MALDRSVSPALARLRVPIGIASLVLLLALWQIVSVATEAGRLSGSPLSVVRAIPNVIGDGLIAESLYSLRALVVGMAISIVAGVTLGIALGSVRWLAYLLEPVFMAFYVTPTVAILPLVVIWAGVGNASSTIIVVLSAIFPITINTIAGVRQLDPHWTRSVLAFGGSRLTAFRLVAVNGALPEIILGIRLGIGRALIGVIVAEMYASVQGIGSLMGTYSHAMRISELFVVVIVIGVFGFLIVQAARSVEIRVGAWRR
jgi:ABC-type nitrate/sulfonate/bicarbonate transport system permease component